MEFGEAILWKRRPVGGALGKPSCLWEDGLYLGIHVQSGELIVSDREGVWRTRTVQRKPIEDRWPEDAHETSQKTPWTDAEEDEMQGETEKLVTEMTEAETEKQIELEDKIPARFYIRNVHLEKHGFTANCPGCRAALRRTTKQKHTETCRARLFDSMADDDRVVRSTKRTEEFVARKAEEQDVKKRRVDFENSERQFEEPSGDKRDDAENSGMDFDGEREQEREGPPRPLEGGGEQGPSKKPRLLTSEDVAKKTEDGVCAGAEDMKIDGVLVNGLEVNQHEEYAADEWVFDELSGRWLDGDKVAEARSEEIGYTEKELDMFVPATWEECVEESGRPPISTKWVDVDKGTVQNQIIRSRLVVRDFRVKGECDRSDLFAAMPPLEAKRMLFRMAVRRCREKPCERNKIMLIDVKKPHLNG